MKHSVENPRHIRARAAFLLITALLGLTSIACEITGGGGGGPDATATYGAGQFNGQLTAVAGPTATFGAEQFKIQLTAQANPTDK